MKKLALITIFFAMVAGSAKAQTATELLGKWKLVKWTTKNGKDKPVNDSTFQVFKEKNQFISILDGKEHKGKWKLNKDNTVLTIRSGLVIKVDFKIDYFDSKKRSITADELGTLEYVKVD